MAIIAAYQHDVTDEAGELLSNVTVRVVSEGNGALPQLYAGPNTATDTALGNPFVQADGKVYFHVTGGTYKITLSAEGQADRVLRHVPIGRAQGTDLQLSTPAGEWSALTTYTKGQWVRHGGYAFVSMVDANLNNDPDDTTPGDTASWMFLGDLALINPSGAVLSTTIDTIQQVTQAEYDALSPPDAATLYVIVG